MSILSSKPLEPPCSTPSESASRRDARPSSAQPPIIAQLTDSYTGEWKGAPGYSPSATQCGTHPLAFARSSSLPSAVSRSSPTAAHIRLTPSPFTHQRNRRMNSADVLTFTTIHSLTFERGGGEGLSALPTRDWACMDLSGRGHILRLTLQHGKNLPRLDVRVLDKGWMLALHATFDESLQWLLEDVDKEAPLLGLDAEGGQRSISLVQLATARRCLLIRMPPADQQAARGTTFSPAFCRLMMDRAILKGGAELWNDVLDIWRSCGRLATNGCVNVTLLHTNAEGKRRLVGSDVRQGHWM